jgi:hypothetical protein
MVDEKIEPVTSNSKYDEKNFFPQIHKASILHDIRRLRTRILDEERALKKRRITSSTLESASSFSSESLSQSSSSSVSLVLSKFDERNLLYSEMYCLAHEVERLCLLQVGYTVGKQIAHTKLSASQDSKKDQKEEDELENICKTMTKLCLDIKEEKSNTDNIVKLAQERALEFPNVSFYIQHTFINLQELDLSRIGATDLKFKLDFLISFVATDCPELTTVNIKCAKLTKLDLSRSPKLSYLTCAFPSLITWEFPIRESEKTLPYLTNKFEDEHSLNTMQLKVLQRNPKLIRDANLLVSTEAITSFFDQLNI